MNNDSMKVQATIDLPSAKKVDEQIRALEKSISKLKVSGQFNDIALKNLTKQLNTLKVNIGTANFSPTTLNELTNQVEKALSNINISGVNIGKEITKSIKNNIETSIKEEIKEIQELLLKLNKIPIDIKGLSGNQIKLLDPKEFGGVDELKSYINTIQEIKNAENTTGSALFDSLQIEEYVSALSDLESEQTALLLSTQGLSNTQIAETLVAKEGNAEKAYEAMLNAGLLKSKKLLTQEELNSTIASLGHTEAETARIAASIASTTAINAEGVATATVTKAKLAEAIQNGVLTESEGALLSAKLGVIAASKAESASLGGSTILNGIASGAKATGKEIGALGSGLLGLAKAHPVIAGLTTAITVGATAWNAYKKHQEKAAEALKETLQKSWELTETYKQEQADLDSTIEKYKELSEQLTNAYLTTEEYNGIKEQLIGLQDDLVSKYGAEADAIDVVNGKYDEQIKKLETISRQNAQEFVYTNFSNAEEAQNFLNDTQSIEDDHKIKLRYRDIYDKYIQNLNGVSIDDGFFSDSIKYEYKGTPEEIRKQIEADINTIIKQYGTTDKYANVVLKDLSELLNREEISSENIDQAEQVLLELAKASVDGNSEIQSAYASYVEGIERYNNALETGEGINEAYSNYEKLREEFANVSADILGIEHLYDNLSSKLNEPLDLSFKLDKNIQNGNESTERYLNKLQGVTSDQLRSLDYDDLLSVNSLNNYEDAFGHLVKQLDVSEAGVDALIDRLIELGYVADSVEIQNKENILNAMGFDKNASSANAAKRNIIATNVYNSLTDKQKASLGDNLDLIPPESYNWTEQQWLYFIKNLQKDADENQLEISTSLDTAEALKSATDAFSKLGDAENGLYADILAGNSIDASDIFALKDDFGDIDGGRALENFANTLLEFPGNTEKAQEALNDLVTAYIDESNILDDLNEGNKDYIRQELEKINVANAEEVVEDRLNDSVKKNIKAFKEFSTVLSQHLDTLKNASPESDKFKNSLETVKASFEDFLKANSGDEEFELSLSDDFIIQNLEDIEAAASGSEEALNRVRIAAAKDIAANVNLNVPPQAYEGTLNQINSWIDNANIDTLQVGTYLDDTPLIQGLNNLVDAGTITRDDMNAILSGIGVTPEISHESVPVTLPDGTAGGAAIGAAIATLQIPRIRYKVSSDGAKARYSAPSTSQSSGGGSGGGGSSDGDDEFSNQIDWIEVNLQRLEEELNRLDKTSSNVYSLWSKRNTALNGQIAKTREEIILQQKAYDDYMTKANSIGLSDTYISKVQNGTIQIEDITDEDLADKISEYQTWYEKAIGCKDTIQELNITLGDLASQKFDNLQTEYDDVISIFESLGSLVDETINRTEEHGYFVAKDYYKQLIDYENQKLNELQQQYAALTQLRDEALKSGAIEENSQEWQNMTQSILDVENAIEQSTTSLVEFNNEIRDLNWEIFDYIAERINQITKESDYLIDLMENNELYNETGAFTSEGKATTALHGINYNTYMQQALDYAKELKDIEQEISKDSANKDLIERREELLELQQDAITNAEAEKDAIKSLVEEGINIHLDALSSLIDKYKEAMNSAKDLYDYQKNISSQVKEISNLEKQILAYEGDDSEEARKIIQETKLSLEEARTELKETEWDKYISETEQLLDTLCDDYEEVLNARLDNIDALVSDMIDMINSNGSEIRNTIEAVADKVGYTITDSLSKALGEGSNVNVLISNFSTKFDTAATTLQSSIDAIKAYVYKMTDEGKNKVASETQTHTNPSSPNSSTSSNSTHNSSNAANATSSSNLSSATSNSGDGIARIGDAVTFVNGKYHEDSWGNGKSGNQLLGGTVYITKIAPNSPYPYHISRTSKFGEANLGWVKLEQLKGYAKGSRRIYQNQLAWTQENGNEMLYRSKDGALLTPLGNGDMVFTNEMTQKLWELANGNIAMPTFNPPKINTNLEQENKTINNDNKITITLPNVKNYDEFKSELQNDNKFVGFVQEVTLGEALGHNSMRRKKY